MNFFNTTHRIEPFFFEYDQRIGLFFLEYDAKNWTLYFLSMSQWIEPLNFLNLTQRIDFSWIWRKELDSFFKYYSKEWPLFSKKKWHKELNSFLVLELECFFKVRVKELNFFVIWLKELNSLFFSKRTMTQRIEPNFNTTRNVDFFKQKLWLKEFNLFLFQKKNSKNWNLCF